MIVTVPSTFSLKAKNIVPTLSRAYILWGKTYMKIGNYTRELSDMIREIKKTVRNRGQRTSNLLLDH